MIAAQSLPRGLRFPAVEAKFLYYMVDWRLWPADTVPYNAITQNTALGRDDLDYIIGNKIVRTDIAREQPILWSYLASDYDELASIGAVPTVSPLARGSLSYDEPVSGEINNVNWMDDWEFAGGEGETVSFTMETTGGNLSPFLLAWSSRGEWVDGQRTFDGQMTTLTVTLPYTGVYRITATRARTNNGSTAGTYRLSAAPGYALVGGP